MKTNEEIKEFLLDKKDWLYWLDTIALFDEEEIVWFKLKIFDKEFYFLSEENENDYCSELELEYFEHHQFPWFINIW